ncbi:MAG TPA: alpha/beta hydrolase [Kineobactrum sp.]
MISLRTLACCLLLLCPMQLSARTETNIVYGMVSGTALLLDVYSPPEELTRGLGVLFVPGSGWHAAGDYEVAGLKDMNSDWAPGNELARAMVSVLVQAGYTVFVANHRGAPVYRYPAAADDIARAVRFIRANAGRFGIDASRLGGAGTSSGGALVSLLGVDDSLPAESRLQVIVTQGAPMDLVSFYTSSAGAAGTLAAYMGFGINYLPTTHPQYQAYVQASSTGHIGAGDAPHLLVHGDADELVPLQQARQAATAFMRAGVPMQLLVIPGAMHSEKLLGAADGWLDTMTGWFDRHLAQ